MIPVPRSLLKSSSSEAADDEKQTKKKSFLCGPVKSDDVVKQKLIRSNPSACSIATECSSSVGSFDDSNREKLPICSAFGSVDDNIEYNLEKALKEKLKSRERSHSSALEKLERLDSFQSHPIRSPATKNTRREYPDSSSSGSSSGADEKIVGRDRDWIMKTSQFSPRESPRISPRMSPRGSPRVSRKDDTSRSQKAADYKQKLSDSVTKRQRHTSMATAKASSNRGAFRPISMSLSKRKSVASKRFDIDTLALLTSLNLINKNDNEAGDNDDEVSLVKQTFSPLMIERNGETNLDDDVYDDDEDNSISNGRDGNDDVDQNAHSYDEYDDLYKSALALNFENGISRKFGTMDSIYEENSPHLDVIRENSPHYFSTNNSPAKPRVRLNELKSRKQMKNPILKILSEKSPTAFGMEDISGLLEGSGLLEFCTVDADLFHLLKDKNKKQENNEQKVKKSIYDIDEDETDSQKTKNDILLSSLSSSTTPKKSHCLPSQNFSIEHIHDFCFPSGVSIDFLPKEKAEILTNTSDYDSFHTLQFTNGKGQPTYACCVTINIQYKPKTEVLRKKLMEIAIMNDAADKIINIFRSYIALKKSSQMKNVLKRGSKTGNNGQKSVSPNIGGSHSHRVYGSTESYGSGTTKSSASGGVNSSRKRSDGSITSLGSSFNDKKSSSSSTKSSKYFTAKNLKGFASKFLYGKPKSPVDAKIQIKENAKLMKSISDELNSPDFNNIEYLNSLKAAKAKKSFNSNSGKNKENVHEQGYSNVKNGSISSSASGTVKSVGNSKSDKCNPSPAQSPRLSPYINETAADIIRRKNMENKMENKNICSIEQIRSINSMANKSSSSKSMSFASTFPTTSALSSSSFASVYENKQKINRELKEKQRKEYIELKNLQKEHALKLKEDSFVLVTQKSYCLISSEAQHASLFQVLKIMVNAERKNDFYSNLHGFEEQEEIASKLLNNATGFSGSCDPDFKSNNSDEKFCPDSDINNYVETNFVIIEKFYRQNTRENTPVNSGKGNIGFGYFSAFSKENIDDDITVQEREMEREKEKEKEKEDRRIAIAQFHGKRNIFLVKIEEYLRKSVLSKSPKLKSTTKITTTEKTDYITKIITTTTVTEKIITETIPIMFNITISDYVDNLEIDFLSFPATKDWTSAILFATLSSEILFKIMHILLTEKSLIIYGTNMGYVTAISLAVLELIKPLVWEGIFVPLISDSARELFEAPVPFILGTTFMPNLDFMSPSAAVLIIQAPEDFQNENSDDEINESGNNFGKSCSEKSSTFDTWKECASNPKKQKKIIAGNKTEKCGKSPVYQSFKSVQPSDDGCEGGPRAWFLRLPDMEEMMPSVPYLGGWIDRTRRFLSNSIVVLESTEKEKRRKNRELKVKRDKIERAELLREQMQIEMKRREIEDEEKEEKNKLFELENEKRKQNNGGEINSEEMVGDENGRNRRFSISENSPDKSPLKIPILALVSNSGKDQNPQETVILIGAEHEESLRRPEMDLQKYENTSELLMNLEKARRASLRLALGIHGDVESGEERGGDKGRHEPVRIAEADVTPYVTDENYKRNRIGNGNDNDEIETNKVVKKVAKKEKNLAIKKRTVSFSVDSFSLDENGICNAPYFHNENVQYVPLVTGGSGQSSTTCSTTSSPTHTSLTASSLFQPHDASSSSNMRISNSAFIENLQSTTASSSTSASPVAMMRKASVSSAAFFPLTAASPSPSPALGIPALFPIFKRTVNAENHNRDIAKSDKVEKNMISDNNTNNNNNNNENILIIKNPKTDTDNSENTAQNYMEKIEDIILSQKIEELDITASNYSPYRTQGNGKTWLEQIIKAADKPLRQANAKKPLRNRKQNQNLSMSLNNNENKCISDSQKSFNSMNFSGLNSSASYSVLDTYTSVKSELSCYSSDPLPPPLPPHTHTHTQAHTQSRHILSPPFSEPSYPPAPPLLPFINGMSKTELSTTQKLLLEIRKYNSTFCGRLSEPNAWKEYVKYNRATNDDEFFPDLFLLPQRRHLEFQESLVKTQLFVAYMDRLRTEYKEKENTRLFISNWLSFRIYIRNKNKNNM